MENKLFTVYRHTSPSGKVYIGITCQDVRNRWQNGKTYKDSTHFKRAIRKYGWKNIKHEVLFNNLPKQRAIDLEISLIRHYKGLGISYNVTNGGEGTNGFHHSKESRQKMSEIMKERCQTEYGKFLCSKGGKTNKGKKYNRKSGFSKGYYHMRKVLQLTMTGNLVNMYISVRDVCRNTDFSYNCLCQALRGKRERLYKGYIWKYEEKQ